MNLLLASIAMSVMGPMLHDLLRKRLREKMWDRRTSVEDLRRGTFGRPSDNPLGYLLGDEVSSFNEVARQADLRRHVLEKQEEVIEAQGLAAHQDENNRQFWLWIGEWPSHAKQHTGCVCDRGQPETGAPNRGRCLLCWGSGWAGAIITDPWIVFSERQRGALETGRCPFCLGTGLCSADPKGGNTCDSAATPPVNA